MSRPPLTLRAATPEDAPALEALIRRSVHGLQADHYDAEQREAALGSVFGVDHRLIADGTYLVAERDGRIVGCGGWSDREALYALRPPGYEPVVHRRIERQTGGALPFRRAPDPAEMEPMTDPTRSS